MFDWFDLLWVGFAVYSAWRTLQPEQPEPVETPRARAPENPRPNVSSAFRDEVGTPLERGLTPQHLRGLTP